MALEVRSVVALVAQLDVDVNCFCGANVRIKSVPNISSRCRIASSSIGVFYDSPLHLLYVALPRPRYSLDSISFKNKSFESRSGGDIPDRM